MNLFSLLYKYNLAGILSSEPDLSVSIVIGGCSISDTPWKTMKFTLSWLIYFFMFMEQKSFSSELVFLPSHQSPHIPPQTFLYTSLPHWPKRSETSWSTFLSLVKFFHCLFILKSSKLHQRTKWLMKTLPSGTAQEITFRLIQQIFSRHQL